MYERNIKERRLNKYGRTLITLPVPKIVVFYNDKEDKPVESVLELKDAFPQGSEADIAVRVRLININHGKNPSLEERCSPLREYAWTVERIRENMKHMDSLRAVDEALEAMPESFVIKPFLMAHKAEVRDMLLTEYNEAETMELFREEGRAEGREEGRAEGVVASVRSLMESLGCSAEHAMELLSVPEDEWPRCLEALS